MTVDYQMRSIPTAYNGIQYRSRLEARWAAFFSNMGWNFVYEPLDLCGWAPDFLLKTKTSMFVEVKPLVNWDDAVAEKSERAMPPNAHPILICGLGLEYPGGMPMIGWMGKYTNNHWFWDDALITRFTGPMSLTEWDASFDKAPVANEENVRAAWADACNKVQWNGQRS